jgi:thioredoxin reductase
MLQLHHLFTLLAIAAATTLSVATDATAAAHHYSRYLIIGAGPGGLQIAHYLESAGRDYTVLDSAPAPASFFTQYPRWRQLISINKKEVGRADSLSFAERHDWNSLLSDASHSTSGGSLTSFTDARLDVASITPSLRFTSWSNDYYPTADTLVDYMRAWAAAGNTTMRGLGRSAPLRVRSNETVTRVSRAPSWTGTAVLNSTSPRFVVTTKNNIIFTCTYLIFATGLQEPVPLPSLNGTRSIAAGLVHTYSNAPTDLEAYRGKRVLIIGHGNAAWEFSHHILGVTAYTHVAGRTTSRVKLALETHYPGNVRQVHASLLETYNLKSLDGITSAQFEKLEFVSVGTNGSSVGVSVRDSVGCTHDSYGRPTARCNFRHPYDFVVACLGWRFAVDVFDEAVRPVFAATNNKHPAVTHRYESLNVEGLFFAGTLAHGPDYKRSSGGSIHGFRYTARALHRFLEEEEYAKQVAEEVAAVAQTAFHVSVNREASSSSSSTTPPLISLLGAPPSRWPSTRTHSLRSLLALFLKRCNDGAGIYQMFGTLVDVFVFDDVPNPSAALVESEYAATERPFDHYDSKAAARLDTDVTGLSAAVAASQTLPPASRVKSEVEMEAAVDAALTGVLLEEVPTTGARALATSLKNYSARTASWLTLSLEFGPAAPAGEHDPFALNRADVGLARANRSHFLHPVIRFFSQVSCGGDEEEKCEAIDEVHIVEDFLSEWRLHRAHILPLSRFLQDLGTRRARDERRGFNAAAAWLRPPPPILPPPAFLGNVLTQLSSGCESATLHFRGAAHNVGGGGGEGWWLTLSVSAERALHGLRALAVHAIDGAPGVHISVEEEAYTTSVREKWAAARAGAAFIPDTLPQPAPPPANAAALSAREEAVTAWGALTRGNRTVAVLVIDARAGRCRVLAERLAVELNAVRVFEPGGADGTKGTSVDIKARPLNAKRGASHVKQVLLRG